MVIKLVKSFAMGVYYHVWEWVDYLLTVLLFYRKPGFALTDLLLQSTYFFSSADRLCFTYLQHQPEDQVQIWYGETPLRSFKTLCQAAQISSEDHLFELGSGRGRLAFWADRFVQCTVTGVEINPIFIARAQRIKRLFRRHKLRFLQTNILDAPLAEATVIYLYGTAFEKPAWPRILHALQQTRPGTRVITVSKSLAEWGDTGHFALIHTHWISYVWGKAPVYIQTRVDHHDTITPAQCPNPERL
ncbi:MAG: class I SAM-dependent methyltransferase [Gammaproteobacteria bacterium]